MASAGPVALLVAGCGTDPVGTPVQWWHDLQGGAIAEQRPPPPGVDDPYPHVGTTPSRPAVPSVAARDTLTNALATQQYASNVTDARAPIAPPTVPARPAAGATPGGPASATPPSSASATLDAAGTTPPNAKPAPAKPVPTPEQQEAGEPMLAMPPPPGTATPGTVTPGTVTIVTSGPLPTMPRMPPAPPQFPNFVIPTTQIAPIHPDFGLAPSSDLRFEPGSDVMLASSRKALVHAVGARGPRRLRVSGYGDAASDAPADQGAALRLALARAATVAETLEHMGVPSSAIVLAASAFGRGGDVTVLP